MLAHFPKAQQDELLTSVLARFIYQLDIKDDKVALDILFKNRMVIPSAFLQGHIDLLLSQVGHLWRVDSKELISQHTLLPLFQPFLPNYRYEQLMSDLSFGNVNLSMSRAGINASLIQWPLSYKICPQCRKEQLELLGFTYWQRLFQSPGVTVCLKHECCLVDTSLRISSSHRHRFIGTLGYQPKAWLSEAAKSSELELSSVIEALLNSGVGYVSPEQWTRYYQNLARDRGMMKGAKIDHQAIKYLVEKYWTKSWLEQHGLQLTGENTWLLSLFRKHRRPFSYLQHFVVWLSLRDSAIKLNEELNLARSIQPFVEHKSYRSIPNSTKRVQTRKEWFNLLKSLKDSPLKEIRSTSIGAKLYSWLYRYDRKWLDSHKPQRMSNYQNKRVDWASRDLKLVKTLIQIKNHDEDSFEVQRRSKSWYSTRINQKTLMEKKLHKLPLCRLFLDRYSESIEEYQVRRLTRVMVQLVEHKDILRPVCEIEKLAGLSHKRSRQPAREILRLDIPAWQRTETFS